MTDPIAAAPPTGQQISLIVTEARKQWALEREIERLEETLKAKKEELKGTCEKALPDAMLDAGVEAYSLTEGYSVKLDTGYHGAIPKEDDFADGLARARGELTAREKAFKHLDDLGAGPLIKNTLTIEFGADQHKDVMATVAWLKVQKFANSISIENKKAVHAKTLGKFVSGRINAIDLGEEFPVALDLDTLGVHVRRVSSIKILGAKKKKKGEF